MSKTVLTVVPVILAGVCSMRRLLNRSLHPKQYLTFCVGSSWREETLFRLASLRFGALAEVGIAVLAPCVAANDAALRNRASVAMGSHKS